ncbi:hypothetical protein [Hymenobacter sp. BRD67]|uniref:hypothetical protein n=1 Tax=Hymenobacter sp. BRD67 TaxID=2675877 RepID=UPI00156670BC|nr:hypothetical protein [Hymenobacter sp. BRD67]QKG51239.1 hypothetical protein GKZ67_03095 [Hymenobacter sp. BRD67]
MRTHWGSLDLLVNKAGIGMRTVNPDLLPRPQMTSDASNDLTGQRIIATEFASCLAQLPQ